MSPGGATYRDPRLVAFAAVRSVPVTLKPNTVIYVPGEFVRSLAEVGEMSIDDLMRRTQAQWLAPYGWSPELKPGTAVLTAFVLL